MKLIFESSTVGEVDGFFISLIRHETMLLYLVNQKDERLVGGLN